MLNEISLRRGEMVCTYSIVFYDTNGDSPPQVRLFPSEEAAIDSVVSDVARFRSLHEDADYPDDGEVRASLSEEGILSFESLDGVEYSWKLDRHPVAWLTLKPSGCRLDSAAQAGKKEFA